MEKAEEKAEALDAPFDPNDWDRCYSPARRGFFLVNKQTRAVLWEVSGEALAMAAAETEEIGPEGPPAALKKWLACFFLH